MQIVLLIGRSRRSAARLGRRGKDWFEMKKKKTKPMSISANADIHILGHLNSVSFSGHLSGGCRWARRGGCCEAHTGLALCLFYLARYHRASLESSSPPAVTESPSFTGDMLIAAESEQASIRPFELPQLWGIKLPGSFPPAGTCSAACLSPGSGWGRSQALGSA